ncbi:MAG: methyltransferase domain-containing protein [Candidatus Lokiarchaeota archaeon]|nr:methyltransferase domain-containing protein [Candidatus Lokiarchaeota archaeon]
MFLTKYDIYYEERDHFGEPYPELVKFFSEQERRGKVLDLGCGQGRDALALARLGYDVTGVDHSSVGIKQMIQEAKKENLQVEGVVADLFEYPIEPDFDYVLLDSILHFYRRDREKETQFLHRIMDSVKIGAFLCMFVSKSKTTEPVLEKILKDVANSWTIVEDRYIKYREANSLFRMVVVQKKASEGNVKTA